MVKLVKYIIFGLTLLFAVACVSSSEKNEALSNFLGEHPDSMSFDDVKQSVLENYMQYALFYGFSEGFGGRDELPQSISEEEERYDTEFRLSPLLSETDFKKGISFIQSAAYKNAWLDIDSKVKEGETNNINYYLDKIYYHDNTSDTSDVSISSRVSVGFKKIDSVRILVRCRYPVNIERVELSSNKKKIEYGDGAIALKNIDNNYIEYVMSDNISGRFLDAQAVNKSGKTLNRQSMSSSSFPPEEAKKVFKKLYESLKKITEKIKKDKYKTKEDLCSDIYNKLGGFGVFSESENYYRSEFYSGNVESLYLYFTPQRESEEFLLTFPVVSSIAPVNLVWDRESDKNFLVDSLGNEILELTKGISPINSFYYTYEDYYKNIVLRLNLDCLAFDTLQYRSENIEFLTNTLVKLNYRGKVSALDRYGNAMIPPLLGSIRFDENSGLLIASSGKSFGLYSADGELLFSGDGGLDSFSEGVAIYWNSNRELVAFIDEQGRQVIPLRQYDHVQPFSEGLSVVGKNDKYGCIRKDGSIVIPLIYDEMKNFSYGVTLVQKGREYGLINTNNEFVLPLHETYGYSISGSFEKRTYRLNGKIYNEKGILIEDGD